MAERPGTGRDLGADVVRDFGDEWSRFDQSTLPAKERESIFEDYFSIFPWSDLPPAAVGFDAGCGTGRWAALVAPRVGHLHCVDPSAAIDVARKNLRALDNCSFHRAGVEEMPLGDASMDFGYSLGVLHHIDRTEEGMAACVRKLKKGAPFLLYLYYAFDNRPRWFRALWKTSDAARRVIADLPFAVKHPVSDVIALTVYLPLARTAGFLEKIGAPVGGFPLSAYRGRSFYSMRTDALDRFGTKLEKRFSRDQIRTIMERAGLSQIRFSPRSPFWCAVGIKD